MSMTGQEQECKICGRTERELEEIKAEPEIIEHQGIQKCKKCRRAYNLEDENETQDTPDVDVANKMGWKV